MSKKIRAVLAAIVMLHAASFAEPVHAGARPGRQAESAESVKQRVAKIGADRKTRVVVKLSDGTQRKGVISEIKESSFVLSDAKTGQESTIAYADVRKIKKEGVSLGTTILLTLISVGIGVAAAAAAAR